MHDKPSRTYDVVLWGVTGFTGKLVAEFLLDTYGSNETLRWAIAGRNPDRLAEVMRDLGEAARDLDVLVGDAQDRASLDAITSRTRVVCTTVGPYSQRGSQLVASAVQQGTDYCDLSGEVLWIQRMIDEHHDAARASGARIVTSCGFDSIPSDCGTRFLMDSAITQTGRPCVRVTLLVEHMGGAMSGGTVESLLDTLQQVRKSRDAAAVVRDPYSLNPPGERHGPDGPDQTRASFHPGLGAWTTPFIMAGINTRIVRRTHALLGYPYGREFRYGEASLTGMGWPGRLSASAQALGLSSFLLGAVLTPSLLRTLLPKPGQGPDQAQRESGSFSMRLVGEQADGAKIQARVTGDRDPGYGSTSRMLGEAAVCLAKDLGPEVPGGVLTPAFALHTQLVPRLVEKAGMTFELL